MSKVKPCPFCGGDVRRRVGLGGILFHDCLKCGAIVSFIDLTESGKMQADSPEKLWNRRVPQEEAAK